MIPCIELSGNMTFYFQRSARLTDNRWNDMMSQCPHKLYVDFSAIICYHGSAKDKCGDIDIVNVINVFNTLTKRNEFGYWTTNVQ